MALQVVQKYEFTALDSNDLLDKIRTRLSALGLTTEYSADNIIGGVTLGKRLHMKTPNGFYLNFGSGLNRNPAVSTGATNTNWVSANAQCVAATISRTLNTSLSWFINESNVSTTSIACVYTENNCLTRIFTTANSIAIVTNYSSIYYNTLYINWETNAVLTSTACIGSALPKAIFGPLLLAQSLKPNEIIIDNLYYRTVSNDVGVGSYEATSGLIVPAYTPIYDRMFNLVNKASAALPFIIYFRESLSSQLYFIKNPLDIATFNMKNTDPAFIFENNGLKHQAFPNYTVDPSSNASMGIIFRIE